MGGGWTTRIGKRSSSPKELTLTLQLNGLKKEEGGGRGGLREEQGVVVVVVVVTVMVDVVAGQHWGFTRCDLEKRRRRMRSRGGPMRSSRRSRRSRRNADQGRATSSAAESRYTVGSA